MNRKSNTITITGARRVTGVNAEKAAKPIPEQIFDKMMSEVRKKPEFNGELVKALEELYANDGLAKGPKIIEIIKPK